MGDLGTIITVRFSVADSARLRAAATRAKCGYGALLRRWVEERLIADTLVFRVSGPELAGEGLTVAVTHSDG